MAAITPPRSASPAPPRSSIVVPKPRRNLQISPNLEALLQHDELTRRNSSSPTNAYSSSSGFPISLPPPPPRIANGGRKREQESFPTARNRDGQRSKSTTVVSDFWSATDGSAAGQSVSSPSSRPASPNPYLNPTPVLRPINTPDLDEVPTPKQADKPLLNEPLMFDSSRVAPETRVRAGAPDPSHRPSTALHKVEKKLWMGRDSLSLFSGPANAVKRGSDRRNDHIESGDFAVQDRQMRQVPTASSPSVSRPPSTFGDSDTATVALSSKSATSYFHSLQRGQLIAPSETPSHLTRFESGSTSDPSFPPLPPALLLPRLSLPSISMPHNHNPPQQHKSADSVTSNDYLSFIDFFSPSTVDESNLCNIQDKAQENRLSRQQLQSISIPPPSLYSIPRSLSSTSLASMKFAPPSPTSTVHQPSPTYPTSSCSTSSTGLPSMKFAPPSPSAELVPTRLQPLSDPPSPYSPLEFAPPPSLLRGVINTPSLPVAPGLIAERAERGRKLKSKMRSKSSSPYHVLTSTSPLPPTTNELDANERADRIRRNRKLARVFGRTPGAEDPVAEADDLRAPKKSNSPLLAALLTKPKSHRHAASVTVSGVMTEPSTPWTDNLLSPDGRRHSTPLASDFTSYVGDQRDRVSTKYPLRSRKLIDSPETASTRSFIDLSDEEPRDDDVSELSCFIPYQNRYRRLHHSNSTPSLVESLDSVALAEVDRRRKREKLARLHRFLGSRVPLEAVNGCACGPPLPPPAPFEEPDREHMLCRNKDAPHDDFDRGREELDEREKALNVRRAQKMEKVFGTPPPPQALYHTRPSRSAAPVSQPASPTDVNPYVLHLDFASPSRNPNQSAYVGKTLHRQGPSDSSRCLLSHQEDTPQSSPSSLAQSFTDSFTGSPSGYQRALAQTSVYLNYQHSLNSLIDIIDRDDRQSLVELHRFLQGCEANDSASEEEVAVNPRRISNATSLRSERRHSLPSNTSMTSLSSEFYASPQTSRLQIRRRKAAKLTNFFGVDYRELIHDILESIEKGVEEERTQGTLQPQEVEVLMHRVRSLRKMKDPFSS